MELTRHLAELSKIAFSDAELDKMTSQMSDIINLMDKVKFFGKNDKTYALDARAYSELRKDEPCASFETEKMLKNAKQVKNNSFAVPKVV
ncbi:MAG: Asp-tRNA(Asn)/Glu-tRNA(Gln) amidotransferase subunit GatC [Clostridia bacterium]|nr:Asp-tRNA(Asn)/Glu-tRNA(Gln) amidotransferase subunit GatC [Clostridia bacterium]